MGDRGTGPGLTTVVFVDVEASTELLDRVGDDAGLASVGSQLGVVLERVEAYGGRVVKSMSDGLLLTFSSPRQAALFALASQRALAGSAPRVRFGINTGEVIAADADPLGSTVNAASRIAGRAAGGEVLVADVVRLLIGNVPSLRFVDRGRCRLKGFSERWHLWAAEDSTTEQHAATTVGRVAELAAVADLVSSTAAGFGRVLLLEGEAGVGKTHLVGEATTRARRAGIGVVEVASEELVHRPGAVPHRLLDATRPGLVSWARLNELLNGQPGRAALGEDFSYLVVEASIDLVEEMSRHDPLLVAAEDLHWADDLSLAVLIALVRLAPVSPFAVIASLRPSPCPPALDRLVETVQDGAGRRIRLGGLDDIDVHALASVLTGGAPSGRLRQRLRATAGNPMFVTELLRSLDDDNLLRVESGVVDVTADVTPTSLHNTLVRRLSWLPQETNELLRLASLLGNAFTLHDLAAITGRAVIDIAAWLREASLAGLIVGDSDRLAFRHDLIREAMYGYMLPAERRDLHRAAGHALAQAGAPTQQIAQQFARGALPGDFEAITWLERAADETISLSPSSAISLLQDAVSLTPLLSPTRAALQARTIAPLALCGRYGDAEAVAQTVLAATSDPKVEYIALRGLRVVAFGHGDVAAELAILQRAAAAAGAPADEVQRLRCFVALLSMATGATSADAARQLAEDALAQAVATHDAPTQAVAHQTLGIIATLKGYGFVGREHLTAAIALLDAGLLMSDLYPVSPDTFHALGLLEVDAIEEAIAAAGKARQRAEQLGALARLPGAYLAAAAARLCCGHWDDALAEIEAGEAVVDDTGNLFFVLYYDAVVARIAIHRGNLATAQSRLTAGIQRFTDGLSYFGADWLFGSQAEYLAATGKLEAALAVAEATWTQTAHTRYVYGHRARGILLVRLAVAAARDDLADHVTVELEEGARRCPTASAIATALQCRGLVQRDPDQLLEAVARYRSTPLRPDFAACCEDAAGLLAQSRRRDEAVALLHEAATIHTDINAGADAARVDATLRQFGERRRRQRASRPTFGWESLTPTESNVSRLAAEGLTNPEIGARLYISRRTVETHLSHVYRKLGLPSRTHLCAELTRRALNS